MSAKPYFQIQFWKFLGMKYEKHSYYEQEQIPQSKELSNRLWTCHDLHNI